LSHTPSLCFSPLPLLLSIFSLFTLSLLSLSIATLVHSSFLSSFNYSVHQFLLFFNFLSAFFAVLYPPFTLLPPCHVYIFHFIQRSLLHLLPPNQSISDRKSVVEG